jgi:hypothetical protein
MIFFLLLQETKQQDEFHQLIYIFLFKKNIIPDLHIFK